MNIDTIVGITASIATGTSLLPQLMKIIKDKKAESISFLMLGILFVGLAFWIYYGFLKDDWIIILSNSFSIIVNIFIVIFSMKYQKD